MCPNIACLKEGTIPTTSSKEMLANIARGTVLARGATACRSSKYFVPIALSH